MLDIELREVFPGDKVIMTRGNGVFLAEFLKETACQLHFKYLETATQIVKDELKFYINKGSSRDNVYKV